MGRAEAGTPKDLDRRSKAKGLTRLRWFCSPCNRPFRDEHGFSLHCKSEAHVRQIMLMGNTNEFIDEQTKIFERTFLETLRISHGEKMVNSNAVYQEIIREKLHVHMNSTKHANLTMFVAHLGREGLCRVEERDDGLFIGYIDRSPAALARQDALKKKEALEMGDEQREQQMIQAQIQRAQAAAEKRGTKRKTSDDDDGGGEEEARKIQNVKGTRIALSFGSKKLTSAKNDDTEKQPDPTNPAPDTTTTTTTTPPTQPPTASKPNPLGGMSFKMAGKPKARNIFKEAEDEEEAAGGPKTIHIEKKMSAAERIMKEEQGRAQHRQFRGGLGGSRR